MSETSPVGDVQAALVAGAQMAGPMELPDGRTVIRRFDGTLEVFRDEGAAPALQQGTATVHEVAALVALVDKHADDSTELYADDEAGTITAVFDADGSGGAPAWRSHRAVLRMRKSPAWLAWNGVDGQMHTQQNFATFIEDRAADVRNPDAATMLAIAESVEGSVGRTFKSAVRLDNGQRVLELAEQVTTRAGDNGSLEIPKQITLGIPVFVGAAAAESIIARLRVRVLANGEVNLGVRLDRPDLALAAAFADVREAVEANTGRPVWLGTAPPERR